jgi:DNA-directed RNA polymerase specialized sigma24 family protein
MEMTAAKEVDDIPAPADPLYDGQLDSVLEALNNGAEDLMTAKERKAFHLVVRLGYNYPVAGKKMGLPRGAVQQLVVRAAKKLRILASIH